MRLNASGIAATTLAGTLLLAGALPINVVASRTPLAAESREYFTDEEIDFLRDAQGLSARVPAILQLANIRLVYLAMKSKSRDDKALEKKIAEIHDEIIGKVPPKTSPKPGAKPKPDADEGPGPYLTNVSRIELLRGYIEALDEVRRVIDDAYSQKQEVRGVLDQLEKFCDTSNPLLRRFQSRNSGESQAILDARAATQEALEDTQDALKKVPKTEKTYKP